MARLKKLKKLNNAQTAYFCEQLWLMLNAGMQLNDGLDILCEDLDDIALKDVCEYLSDAICGGRTLHQAMVDSGVFTDYAVNMVQIGGISGRLDDVLKGLSEYYENRSEMERTIRYSVVHPVTLLAMMAVVMAVLVIKVIPMFEGIFSQFDADIGATVAGAVGIARTVGLVTLVVLLAVVAVVLIVALIPPVRKGFVGFLYSFPPTARISLRFEEAKLADAMSMMISSGIAPEEALEQVLALLRHKKLKEKTKRCLELVVGGEAFADAVCDTALLPGTYSRSLKIAYTSGSFDTVWKKISLRCGEEAHKTAMNLISLVEPVIVTLLALMIGAVLLTIMMPLMNIMSALG